MSDPRLHTSLGRIESSTFDDASFQTLYREDKEDDGLTIFIPNWNHRAFLPRALRSALDALGLLEEEDFPAEVVVIDDASRDGSQKLLRTVQALYDDPRLKTLCMRRNYGQARLWNLALRASRFLYVLRLDADNELVPANLSLFTRSIRDTGAAMVYGNLLDVEGGEVTGMKSNMAPTMRLTRSNYVDAFSIVDARKILDLGGYTRIHPYTPEDWEMVLHLIAEEEQIVFVPAVMGYYHKHPMSASGELRLPNSGLEALRRVYAQTGLRVWDEMRVGRIYHPDVGFVDEW